MSVLSARVALLGQDQPWGRDFCLAVFRANFADDLDIQDETVVGAILDRLALDGPALMAQARQESTKEALRKQVDRARELGIFGARSLMVGREMFCGNDPLADTMHSAARGLAGTGRARRGGGECRGG